MNANIAPIAAYTIIFEGFYEQVILSFFIQLKNVARIQIANI